jgi:hypothetical protein
MEVMEMVPVHILVCESVQIDIVEFLESDEDIGIADEYIKT